MQLPAIYFLYDLSPIMVTVRDAGDGLAHLLVRICAVVGGVFAITGTLIWLQCLDRLSSLRLHKGKAQLSDWQADYRGFLRYRS